MKIEDVMAQAAYSQITEAMPSLKDYLLGFGMVDADEEENKGVGVLLAKIGDTYIYIPSIYKHGQICDMDVLYDPENNRFLPVQDNTLSYLMSKRTDITGQNVEKPQMSRGGTNGGAGSVSLNLPFTMFTKVASALSQSDMNTVACGTIAQIILNNQQDTINQGLEGLSAPNLGKLASAAMSEALLNKLDTPEGYNAFAQWYDKADIDKLVDILIDNVVIDRTKTEGKAPDPATVPVKVLTAASAEARDLSDEDKSTILRDGAIIVDNRGLIPTQIYKQKQNSDWQTPSQNGLYELLKLDGSTVTAYVVDLNGAEGFDKFTKTKESFAVIPVDDGLARKVHHIDFAPLGQYYPMDMSIPLGGTSVENLTRDTFDNWHKYIVVTPKGEALMLSATWQSSGNNGHWVRGEEEKFIGISLKPTMLDYTERTGRFVDTSSDSGADWISAEIESKLSPMPMVSSQKELITQIIVGRPTAHMQIRGNSLRVPEGSKIYEIPDENTGNDLDLVDQSNAISAIAERDKLIQVTVYSADGLITLADKMQKKASGSIIDVAKALVTDYAVAPKDAMKIVKEASAIKGGETYLLKIADSTGFDMAFAQEDPAYIDYTETKVLSPMASKELNDGDLINNAMNAGVKEVLDVDLLKVLATDDSSVREIRSYIPRLMSAVDALGRLLFITRVNDDIQDTYGAQRTVTMEKSVKSTFFKLWDIVLGLRQGAVDDISDLLGGDVSQSIG